MDQGLSCRPASLNTIILICSKIFLTCLNRYLDLVDKFFHMTPDTKLSQGRNQISKETVRAKDFFNKISLFIL